METGKNEGLIVLLGHNEGIISYGQTVERALELILEIKNKYNEK
jgi:hypothetical protein